MPKYVWGFVCSRMIVDETNKLPSAIDIVERVSFTTDSEEIVSKISDGQWILVPANFTVAFQLSRENREVEELANIEIIVEAPDGIEHPHNPEERTIPVDMTNSRRQRSQVLFEHFPFKGDGTYLIKLNNNKDGDIQKIGEIPIDFVFKDGRTLGAKKTEKNKSKKK